MIRQRLKTPLVSALLIAMLMGWGGHALSWLNGAAQHGAGAHWHDDHHHHAPSHEWQPGNCTLCQLQHVHVLGDHIHETPHPMLLLSLSAQPERTDLPAWPRRALPEGPVSRIERPPRA
ncbi:hypothetical protein LGR51_08760 [Pseudomonas sp. NP21570]|jgi:hypothetical protein|uniref:DUF2946 domain-containing protein n=1 Tax=Stutzerimonas kunmingensis TaxID=1211807 RepID=A0A9X1N027_9GAMM|nr:hypothetical protein [Stutzerimonas kunmingensis]MCB4794594.1 hypothetical protein [Pseudomonas sp. NP21570]CEG50881.1 conserved exported hypothetical protein [Stutzerimonas xanthomarina]MCD1606282.1 hypothetical protein [Stutzerimonas kunmingensis]PNG01394.1 hypothetical protein CXK98_09170 [Stutzerimonas kunmingensis]UIP34116.1 hypothetical protein LW136_06675 [Stutzerimonas kunmingensis]